MTLNITDFSVTNHLYIVQEERHFSQNIYKIGMSSRAIGERVKNYKNARILLIISINPLINISKLEQFIILKFKEKFGTPVFGYEYFQGDKEEMQMLLQSEYYNIFKEYRDSQHIECSINQQIPTNQITYDNNPVFSFIEDRDDFMTNPTKDGYEYCKFVDFKTEFERTNKKYKLKMSDMTFNRLGLATKQELLCSHCQSLPGYKCCPKKSNTDRKKVRVIIGLKQITSNIIYDDDTEVL